MQWFSINITWRTINKFIDSSLFRKLLFFYAVRVKVSLLSQKHIDLFTVLIYNYHIIKDRGDLRSDR